ncbi:MAG: carboxypeptidase regulatory-like domain-containing protein, partial [Paludibacteraceae bacterium]|nr:carboxypeptidase regulatory-like domain-containing protein [Paludibacteraceae bacterium]
MKKFLLCCVYFLSLVNIPLLAQHTLSGTILSKTDGAPIEMATVRLFSYHQSEQGADSVLVQGAQTAYDGIFVLSNIAPGKYTLRISSVGFVEIASQVTMPNSNLDLPPFRLIEQVQHLAEVNVQGRAAEMTVKGDTIEYNTAAYQVAETAMVEDLLKKMNGVDVDKEGNVTINGEEIKAVR